MFTSLALPPETLMAAELASRHEDAVRHSRSRWRMRRGSLAVRRGQRTDGDQTTPSSPIR